MKKFLLPLLMLISIHTIAASNGATLSVTSVNSIGSVVIDGRSYTVRNGKSLLIADLRQGYHQVKIYSNQSVRRQPFHNTLIYEGRIYLRKGYYTDVMINRFGRVYIDSEKFETSYQHFPGSPVRNYTVPRAIDGSNFNALVQVVKDESFDQTRVSILEQAIHSNHFETGQVRTLLSLITFESNRLALAKKFYPVTIDQQNFSQLYSVFTFSSSKEDLGQFLQSQPRPGWDDDF